jgi:ParB family chromosome partitioning protein
VRRLLEAGSLTAGHARALLSLDDGTRMAELARQAADQGWSVRETEGRVRKDRPGKIRAKKKKEEDPLQKELETELERALGTQVRIRRIRGGVKGRIEVSFYDAEDFERVFELLAGKPAVEVVS